MSDSEQALRLPLTKSQRVLGQPKAMAQYKGNNMDERKATRQLIQNKIPVNPFNVFERVIQKSYKFLSDRIIKAGVEEIHAGIDPHTKVTWFVDRHLSLLEKKRFFPACPAQSPLPLGNRPFHYAATIVTTLSELLGFGSPLFLEVLS